MPVEALGDAIGELAARLHAATYELQVLLREFDERRGWDTGFLSCAHWLSWRTGISPARRDSEPLEVPPVVVGQRERRRRFCGCV